MMETKLNTRRDKKIDGQITYHRIRNVETGEIPWDLINDRLEESNRDSTLIIRRIVPINPNTKETHKGLLNNKDSITLLSTWYMAKHSPKEPTTKLRPDEAPKLDGHKHQPTNKHKPPQKNWKGVWRYRRKLKELSTHNIDIILPPNYQYMRQPF